MKKSTLVALYNYFCNSDNTVDTTTITEDIRTEYERLAGKSAENAALYDEAYAVLMKHLNKSEQTAAELYEKCAEELPEGFSRGKFNYLLRMHSTDLTAHDNGRSPKTYTV